MAVASTSSVGQTAAGHGAAAGSWDGPADAPVEVGLLGPLLVRRHGAVVVPGGPKPRAVLAVLALRAGRVVALTELIDALWGPDAPPAATSSLRAHVSRLRSVIDPDRVGTLGAVGSGYRLALAPQALDATRFGDLVRGGRAALDSGDARRAEALLTEALALWRGPALADLLELPFAAGEAARLTDQRVLAVQTRAAARLALGRQAEDLDELGETLAQHPYHEGIAEQLMRALYREGRQVDALGVYQRVRTTLVDRLGIEPTDRLRRLQQAVLVHAPGLGDARPPARRPRASGSGDTAGSLPARPLLSGGPSATGERPGALPWPTTTFVGRSRDLPEVTRLLADARLVTLLGPGGVGKTRLALEVAHQVAPAFADGAWLVELGELLDPRATAGSVAQAVADVLGVRLDTPPRADPRQGVLRESPVGALRDALRDRAALLVFDGCEHLVEAAGALALDLLRGCRRVRVLATSREALQLDGETCWEVPPLTLDAHAGVAAEAVRLFIDRAARVAPRSGPPDPDVAARICRALDGLPLAIELAAARLRVLEPERIADMLEAEIGRAGATVRAEPLPARGGGASGRQRTLSATIDWSYELLGPDERAFFARLSVFAGGFDLEAATAVGAVAPEREGEALDLLDALVRKSLVTVTPGIGPSPRRYGLLETLRAYAAERLREGDERTVIRRRHARHVLARAEAADDALRGHGQGAWAARLEDDWANVGVAIRFLGEDDPEAALRLAAAVSWFCYGSARIRQGRAWLAMCLAAAPGARAGAGASAAVRARALLGLAALAYLGGDQEATSAATRAALPLAEELADDVLLALARHYAAWSAGVRGDVTDAVRHADAALVHAEAGGHEWVLAEVLMTRGGLARLQGRFEQATELLARAVAVADGVGHVWAARSSRWVAGKVALDAGDPGRAAREFRSALGEQGEVADVAADLILLQGVAGALAAEGDHERGARLLGAVDALSERVGFEPRRMDPVDAARNEALVRAGLDERAYTVAYDRGRALTRPEALDLALFRG